MCPVRVDLLLPAVPSDDVFFNILLLLFLYSVTTAFIEIEDLLQHFSEPNMIDIKMGTRSVCVRCTFLLNMT